MSIPQIPRDILVARQHNASLAPILALPTELLLDITSYFKSFSHSDVITIMALRATCLRFCYLLLSSSSQPSPNSTSDYMQQSYSLFLRSRILHSLCLKETSSMLRPGELVCSACLTTHPASFFYHSALSTPPGNRLCKGHYGELSLCSHHSLTYEKLHAGGRQFFCARKHGAQIPNESFPRNTYEHWNYRWQAQTSHELLKIGPAQKGGNRSVFVGPESVYEEIYGGDGRRLKKKARPGRPISVKGVEEVEDLILRATFLVLQYESGHIISKNEVINNLDDTPTETTWGRDMVRNICPHLNNPALKSLIHKARPDFLDVVYECPNKDCQTFLFLVREPKATEENKTEENKIDAKEELCLVVVRNLGPVTDVTDPQWTTQLYEAEYRSRFGTSCPPLWITPVHRGHPHSTIDMNNSKSHINTTGNRHNRLKRYTFRSAENAMYIRSVRSIGRRLRTACSRIFGKGKDEVNQDRTSVRVPGEPPTLNVDVTGWGSVEDTRLYR